VLTFSERDGAPPYVLVHRMSYSSDPLVWITVAGGGAVVATQTADRLMDVVLKRQQYRINQLKILDDPLRLACLRRHIAEDLATSRVASTKAAASAFDVRASRRRT
jgi:hypothetical protein